MLAAGKSNQAIAGQLVVTLDTVKKHVSHVLGKLGAANRTEAVARGARLGLIPSRGQIDPRPDLSPRRWAELPASAASPRSSQRAVAPRLLQPLRRGFHPPCPLSGDARRGIAS